MGYKRYFKEYIMKWLKPNTFYNEFDVSASTILKLINEGVLKEGVHFKVFPFGRRFNAQEIEKFSSKEQKFESLINDLLQ